MLQVLSHHSFAGCFWCSRRAPERGTAAAILALCHLMLDNVARSKNKKWKNMRTEETRRKFTSWTEQPPSLLLAQLHPLSQKRRVTLLGFYHLPCHSTVSFNPCFPSRAYVVTLLLQVLWWNNCSSLSLQPFSYTFLCSRKTQGHPQPLWRSREESSLLVLILSHLS